MHTSNDNGRKQQPRKLCWRSLPLIGLVIVIIFQILIVIPIGYTCYIKHDIIQPSSQNNNDKGRTQQQNSFGVPPARYGLQSLRNNSAKQEGQVADGKFNGIDIYYRNGADESSSSIHSTVHCVGENYQERAWLHRSCEFRNLCLDVDSKEFVLFQSPQEERLHQRLQTSEKKFATTSSSMNTTVSLGGINPKWNWIKEGIPLLEWFPKVIEQELSTGYYQLPEDIVWVPFHSFAGYNPGHLLWDDFLPIYTLLSIFQLLEGKRPLMLRMITDPILWASCEYRRDKKHSDDCGKMFAKFLPLMGIPSNTFSTLEAFQLETKEERRSKYVCAPYGAAGLGMLTDHALTTHGWEQKDYESSQNVGRGAMLYRFRNFMVQNMGLPVKPPSGRPYKITFSIRSSSTFSRSTTFPKQVAAVKKEFPEDLVEVKSYKMATLSVEEQVRIASESSIYITVCGGGAITASFLPHGASLFMYYDETGGIKGGKRNMMPARLDFDMVNNMAYVRAHWLPLHSMDEESVIDTLIDMIRHELDIISHQT